MSRTRIAPRPRRSPAGPVPPERRGPLRAWLLTGAWLTFAILVVGGITRLTGSGLSMVDWQPIVGIVPPLTEAEWAEAFHRYQQYPEFRKLRPDMTLSDFRLIFFWEYTHRLLARLIGLVFLIPFAVFLARGWLHGPLLRRVLLLLALGALQGFVGWFMVRSGLVDDPRVSHYRLALHLFMALSVLGLCLWLAHGVGGERPVRRPTGPVLGLGVLLLLQILWGAFVAGLDAGLHFNTFPTMGGGWLPPGGLSLHTAAPDLVTSPGAVQWMHRVLGTLLLGAAGWAAVRERGERTLARAFLGLMVVQYGLGIATLLYFVPIALGVLHQATAVLIFAVWLRWLHRARRAPRRRLSTAAPASE